MYWYYLLRSYVRSYYGKVSLLAQISLLSFVLMLGLILRGVPTKKQKLEK